ncbi:MAG: 1-acyl-sn-glycerol-3-phosphate acyltransferase [Chitinophagaceae bacterium]|nr:1-acyl-sn-glycerol-3-phosphate acyltransferase [Chitinophagaceae bacterium]MCB9045356.1 1-acyl-sn-glycerol-3-phosphate acyltransferase [Chitinophagales bacterium]
MIDRILQPFYSAWIVITYVVCLLGAFPVIFTIGLWDKPAARKTIWYIVHYWAKGWLFCVGMPVTYIGKRPDDKKYVYVANHISYLDTILIYAAIPFFFRTLAKKEMARIPIFGYVYKQIAVLVDRNSSEGRSKSMRLMWRVLKHECNIAVFPEGTFNETGQPLKNFYDGAFRLAINTGTPILPMIFPDTVKRWHYSTTFGLKPGRNRAVYLEAVSCEGMTMDDLPQLRETVYKQMEEAMIRYTAE